MALLWFITAFGVHSWKILLDLPPRYMWGWAPPSYAVGYCGSMSLQTVGLYFGNWITQDAARGTNGGHGPKNSLLLPDSESHALKVLKFNHSVWDSFNAPTPQHEDFIQWTRDALYQGDPVIFGVYMKKLQDPDYDHIVPMVTFKTRIVISNTEGEVGYDASGIYFNDLHDRQTLRYEISEFITTRKGCVGSEEFDYCLPKSVDYGVRVHGNADAEGVLLPIKMRVDSWTEPDYSKEDGHHETPVILHANFTISELVLGLKYAVLKYDSPEKVPQQDFTYSE